jgi:hypothetical protein
MTPTTVPAPVQGYIAESNALDSEALIAWFAEPTPAGADGWRRCP